MVYDPQFGSRRICDVPNAPLLATPLRLIEAHAAIVQKSGSRVD